MIVAATPVRHENTYGAHVLPDGDTRFRLWAPDAKQVEVVIEGASHAMEHDERGQFCINLKAAAGTRYLYRIDDTHEVPDPASRAQPDGVHSASAVVGPDAYQWTQNDWKGLPWTHAVICELHVGAMGGFDGVRAALPQLSASGYTAIELMPIAAFEGTRNWGYDGVLPYAPDADYGTPQALKALIDEAHRLGLMVILDVVYNHFGPVGNYLASYASAFFRDDLHTPWGSAIDFRKPEVARYFIDNALMWLHEYRFDGLRLDAVHAIHPKSFLEELATRVRQSVPEDRFVHLILENEDNTASLLRDDFDAQWNDDGHNALHVWLTDESEGYYADFHADPVRNVARVLESGFVFQGQADRRGVKRGEPSSELSPVSFVLFLQNHDQIGNRPMGERLRSLVSDDNLRAATVLVALSPMIPLFFMGEEWGCRTPFFFFTDYEEEMADKVRNGRREEFAHFAGFTNPAKRERIPDPNALSTFEASIPRKDDPAAARAWQEWFSHLLALRQQHLVPALSGSRFDRCTMMAKDALHARWKLGDGSVWEILVNMSDVPVALPVDANTEVVWHESPVSAASSTASNMLAAHAAMVRVTHGHVDQRSA